MNTSENARRRVKSAFFVVLFAAFAGCSSPSPLTLSGNNSDDELAQLRQLTISHLDTFLLEKAPEVSIADLQERYAYVDEFNIGHVRFQQAFLGIPVFQGEIIAHINSDGSSRGFTDTLVRDVPADLSVQPAVSTEEAIHTAIDIYSCEACLTEDPSADLWILRHNGEDFLSYRVQLHAEDGIQQAEMPVVFVDAQTGRIIWAYDNLQTGTGTSVYVGNVSFNTHLRNGTYYLENLSAGFGTFEMRNLGTTTTYRYSDVNDIWSASVQAAGVDVHYGTGKFLEYLWNVHGRNGLDGIGGPKNMISIDNATMLITSKARYNVNWCNASWNGSFMAYGNGNGGTCGPLVSLDVIGHEMTHAITQFSAGLVYANESGALNESWSDVFGTLLEHYVLGPSANNWLHGEDYVTPGIPGDASRYQISPHQASNKGYTVDDDPDHYSERYIGGNDNGGVHINSGIANKVFSLVAVGGNHHLGGSMVGIGVEPAGRIWYRALTTYMTSGTNFAGARQATLNAASDIYGLGSLQHNAVQLAWTICGIN